MIRVLLAAADSETREHLRAILSSSADVEIIGQARDGQEAVQMAHAVAPQVAVLMADMPICDGWRAAEFLAMSGMGVEIILLSSGGPDDLRRAMRAGAREHLAWPTDAARLFPLVQDVAQQRERRRSLPFVQEADPQRMCRIITVSGAKGGVGKTTLATNLALALHGETGERTVLLDLYTQFGDVAMLLNLTPQRSLAELADRPIHETDTASLDDCIVRHDSGLDVLIGAASPVALDTISAAFLDHIFGILKSSARFVVVDVPPILHPTTLHALSHASQALLVANLFDITTLKGTRLLLEAIEGRYVPHEKIAVVLNRACRQNRLAIPDIERALGHPVAATIPNDGRIVPQSVNQGAPFVLSHPRSAVARSVQTLAARILSGSALAETAPGSATAPSRRWMPPWRTRSLEVR